MNPITLTRAARAIWGRRAPITAVGASVLILMSQSPFAATVAQAQSSQPITQNDANTSVHDHWMADMPGGFGRLKLGQVILPASHDSGTYAFLDTWAASNVATAYATTQDIDVYTQLQHGVRVLDLRGRNFSGGATLWAGLTPGIADVTKQLPQDYYVYHGEETSDLPLATVLDDVASWVLAPGHDKEVVIVQVAIDGEKTQRLTDMCNSFKQQVGPVLLKPDTFHNATHVSYTATDIAQNTLTDVWSLPGHQRVILNWDGCGPDWPTGTFNGYWANQCYAKSYNSAAFDRPGIIGALQTALNSRLSALGGDGLQGGSGQIDTRPSTMPGSPLAGIVSTTAGSVAPGSYAIKFAWLSPLGETRASPEGNVVVPEGSTSISFSLPPFPPGVTGAAIYMSSVGSSVVTRQGQTTTTSYTQTVPPTTTGQTPHDERTGVRPKRRRHYAFHSFFRSTCMARDMFIDFAAGGAPVNAPSGLGPVQGESLDQTYPKTIQISSFVFGVQNPTTIGSSSAGAGAGKAQCQALKFTKNVDRASLGLFTALATGSHFKGVKLYVRVGGTKTAHLVYEFGLMFITQIQSMNGESGIQEEVQAVFGATQLTYSQQLPTGQLASPQTATWNQVTNTPTLTIPGN